MLETITFPTDKRKTAEGFVLQQRVKLKLTGETGTITGFGPAMHNGCTVKIKLDKGTGNMGDHHSCGSAWVEDQANQPD